MFNKLVASIALTFGFIVGMSLLVASVSAQDNRVTLQTPEGIFIGSRENVDRDRTPRVYYAFRGIEYAKAERWEVSKYII